MKKILTIYDWWDGPLWGLITYKEFICIYERIFDKDTDEWSVEYYLTPIDENTVNVLLKDWDMWCKKNQNKGFLNTYSSEHCNLYHNAIESSVQKRVYKRMPVFYGAFDKGIYPYILQCRMGREIVFIRSESYLL